MNSLRIVTIACLFFSVRLWASDKETPRFRTEAFLSTVGDYQHEVTAQMKDSQILVGWSEKVEADHFGCAYTISPDSGITWRETQLRVHKDYPYALNPTVAIDDGGTLYRLCMVLRLEGGFTGFLEFSTSKDGGLSWSEWKKVVHYENALPDKPWLVAEKSGALHLGFVHATSLTSPMPVKYLRSFDGGRVWSSVQTLSNGISGGDIRKYQGVSIQAVDSWVGVTWGSYRSGKESTSSEGEVFFVESSDRGASFSIPRKITKVSNLIPVTNFVADRTLGIFGVSIHEAHRPGAIFVTASSDSGRSWKSNKVVESGMNANIIVNDGKLEMVWSEVKETMADHLFGILGEGGQFLQRASLVGWGYSFDKKKLPYLGAYQSLFVDSKKRRQIFFINWKDSHSRLFYSRENY